MERIHVAVRARPLSPEDAKTSPWKISGNSIFIPNHSTKFDFGNLPLLSLFNFYIIVCFARILSILFVCLMLEFRPDFW